MLRDKLNDSQSISICYESMGSSAYEQQASHIYGFRKKSKTAGFYVLKVTQEDQMSQTKQFL